MGQIILDYNQLKQILDNLRQQGKTIVTINGCFDLLHCGHIRILRAAKEQGDILVVGINSDESVRLNKGPDRPLIPQSERAELLAGLEMVDLVTIFPEKDCMDFIKRVKPDIHVNDSAYGYDCIEKETVEECGGKLYIFSKVNTASTTDIIEKIKNTK